MGKLKKRLIFKHISGVKQNLQFQSSQGTLVTALSKIGENTVDESTQKSWKTQRSIEIIGELSDSDDEIIVQMQKSGTPTTKKRVSHW